MTHLYFIILIILFVVLVLLIRLQLLRRRLLVVEANIHTLFHHNYAHYRAIDNINDRNNKGRRNDGFVRHRRSAA